ncbi:hypothetical protein [Yinghuangia seranimata]|uniref:hypothetical protein n=1 Tax=Yinghuangia seranimata TaxID=408067 RepID=UPI00248CF32E|nr:hypothetical protein [Yinghuangia seranimata]MDI2129148.1 hypothetical protein [Yinghuangia seranimata]
MTNKRRVLAVLALTGAALSFCGIAQADDVAHTGGTNVALRSPEAEGYDHHLTLSDAYGFEFHWSK